MIDYIRNKNRSPIFKKEKCPFLAAGGKTRRIILLSNSLEFMGVLLGHTENITCLTTLAEGKLVSASDDKSLKLWDIQSKTCMITLSEHRQRITAICQPRMGVIVVSQDKSLLIWDYLSETAKLPRSREVLIGHTSTIYGILRLNNSEILSGEFNGILKIWNIDKSICIKHIPAINIVDILYQLKNIGGKYMSIVVCNELKIIIWGCGKWRVPIMQLSGFNDRGRAIEALSVGLLLRGGNLGTLTIINHRLIESPRYQTIKIHSRAILDILRIAKNIVAIAFEDGTCKIIDPISRKCYYIFMKD